MKQLYIFVILLSFSFIGFGQTTLVTYDFTGQPGTQATQLTATLGSNITATPISRGTLATGSALTNSMVSGNWPLTNSINIETYFEFSVTPTPGYVLTLNQLIFSDINSRNGALSFAIRTNFDAFANDVFTDAIPSVSGNNSVTTPRNINLPAISSSNAITIRIYGYNRANGANRSWGLTNNMQLTGTVTPITYVYDNGWTPANPEGLSTNVNPIEIVSGNYTFGADVTCESITVSPGSTITVNNGVLIEAVNGINLQSVSNNYSGLILNNGFIDGPIRYSRYVNAIGSGTTGGNDLITPPLNGQRFDLFANANAGVLAESGNVRAWAPFNNASGVYENYDILTDRFTLLESGQGFRAATIGGANLLFTGTSNNTNFDATITSETGTFGKWNAIGNPYPSYIDIDAFLNHTVSGLTNIDKLAADAQAIYGYDGSATDGWDVINLANAAGRLMAPGQGFFVAADTGGAFLRFTPAMRTVGSGDDFILGRTQPLTFLKLNATNGSQTYNTDIYFNDNGSLGFDPGYDAKLWGGDTSGFKLYSHVVENNMGIPLALQTVNTNHLSDVIIPLGINSAAGTDVTFSLAAFNLPGTVEVYLEDDVNNTITRIDNGNYTVTLNQTVSGTGRFFLRVSGSSLNIDDESRPRLNIYQLPTEKAIVIAGAINNNTEAHLYDIQGRMVSTTVLNAAQLEQRIDVSGLGTGVYVLSFENGAERISKKLMIQ
ncbi:T9SS type A sorting domain-containing protein [Paucihalobacter ruber]|uniref:T9SS type A sorting domain-containing protein n=1 Tax=Paucihalobacter ruber TaxID=2567861 RepID=A0A506PPX7_9FLAO|nr:T9SS type A sorting domain-containing protein [Paucihalobacter ruber]TPV35764.1 T9SS type A sorting domain-containing protein [Paucihalobacter ruber]